MNKEKDAVYALNYILSMLESRGVNIVRLIEYDGHCGNRLSEENLASIADSKEKLNELSDALLETFDRAFPVRDIHIASCHMIKYIQSKGYDLQTAASMWYKSRTYRSVKRGEIGYHPFPHIGLEYCERILNLEMGWEHV